MTTNDNNNNNTGNNNTGNSGADGTEIQNNNTSTEVNLAEKLAPYFPWFFNSQSDDFIAFGLTSTCLTHLLSDIEIDPPPKPEEEITSN